MTNRQLWAMKRNWLLFRIRGMCTVFTSYQREFTSSLITKNKLYLIDRINDDIREVIKLISKSKYMRENKNGL